MKKSHLFIYRIMAVVEYWVGGPDDISIEVDYLNGKPGFGDTLFLDKNEMKDPAKFIVDYLAEGSQYLSGLSLEDVAELLG